MKRLRPILGLFGMLSLGGLWLGWLYGARLAGAGPALTAQPVYLPALWRDGPTPTASPTPAPSATPTSTASPTFPPGAGYSLRFFGNGVNDIDRVKIPIDPAVPADAGLTDFTLEFWMKALPGENTAATCSPGNDNWITGNIIFDRDIYGGGDYGDYGVSLFDNGVAFGLANNVVGDGLCGSTNVEDGQWHHIAVQHRVSDGWLWLFVDGVLQAQTDGPDGRTDYRDGHTTTYPNSDPYLVIGAEKHDAGAAYPSFSGWVDEVRLSNVLRYLTNFTMPAPPFTPDADTLALYHFDEGSGVTVSDSSGAAGGPSPGTLNVGGNPVGPIWSTDNP